MNKKTFAIGLATLVLSIDSSQTAQAASFTLSFAANNFSGGGTTPPASSISGTIGYDAPTINSAITSLNSINLTIAGKSYTLGEVGFSNNSSPTLRIGGTVTGVLGLSAFTDDFLLAWNSTTLTPQVVSYNTSGSADFYSSSNFTSFSITPTATTAVPEPLTIIGTLIGGAAAVRVRKKLTAANKG